MKKPLFILGFALLFAGLGVSAVNAQSYTTPGYLYYPQPTYPTTNCPTLSYNLYRGLSDRYTGGQVSQLQQFLATYYPGTQSVTGYFGNQTWANLARFQQELGVYPITGGVGPLTRAAIARVCQGTNPYPTQTATFYLNQPFTLYSGGQASEYNGRLDVTLNSITPSPYTLYVYPSFQHAVSATVTLGQRCAAGTYCLWYPQQQYTLTQGQSVSWQGYTVTLTSLSNNSATFTVWNTAQNTICTADAHQCPNGSWVGRSGPNCQFVCPN